MQFDESANGREVDLSPGEEFDLLLPETPTAGYRWILRDGDSCSQLESSQLGAGKIGGLTTHVWRFRAPASGHCSVRFEYRRSWETSSEPARTFSLKVRVRP